MGPKLFCIGLYLAIIIIIIIIKSTKYAQDILPLFVASSYFCVLSNLNVLYVCFKGANVES